MNKTADGFGLGWLPDHPDFRDHTPESGLAPQAEERDVPTLLQQIGIGKPLATGHFPVAVDLREDFSPIEDQGQLGSCAANAGAGILEYFERTAFGHHLDAARLFLYKATRNLMGQTGDTGAFLRTTMQAMVTFGVPPEDYWPYTDDPESFDAEPTAFCYAFAQSYRTVQYYRLDPPGTSAEELLNRIRTNLAAKLPSMFGFTVFSSYTQAKKTGELPYPARGQKKIGGHARCRWLRRQPADQKRTERRGSSYQELLGPGMGRGGVWVTPLRLRSDRASPGLVEPAQGRLG